MWASGQGYSTLPSTRDTGHANDAAAASLTQQQSGSGLWGLGAGQRGFPGAFDTNHAADDLAASLTQGQAGNGLWGLGASTMAPPSGNDSVRAKDDKAGSLTQQHTGRGVWGMAAATQAPPSARDSLHATDSKAASLEQQHGGSGVWGQSSGNRPLPSASDTRNVRDTKVALLPQQHSGAGVWGTGATAARSIPSAQDARVPRDSVVAGNAFQVAPSTRGGPWASAAGIVDQTHAQDVSAITRNNRWLQGTGTLEDSGRVSTMPTARDTVYLHDSRATAPNWTANRNEALPKGQLPVASDSGHTGDELTSSHSHARAGDEVVQRGSGGAPPTASDRAWINDDRSRTVSVGAVVPAEMNAVSLASVADCGYVGDEITNARPMSNNRTLFWTGQGMGDANANAMFPEGTPGNEDVTTLDVSLDQESAIRNVYASQHPSTFGMAAPFRNTYTTQLRAGVVIPNLESGRMWSHPHNQQRERVAAEQLRRSQHAADNRHEVMNLWNSELDSDYASGSDAD